MQANDFDAVVDIDAKVLNTSRAAYYELKFENSSNRKSTCPPLWWRRMQTARWWDSSWELYMGEYGIAREAQPGYHRRRSRLPE